MREDAKLGFAIGILVLGLALAFCCRAPQIQTTKVEPIPAPETAAEKPLAFLPMKAYEPAAPPVRKIAAEPVPPPAAVTERVPPLGVTPAPLAAAPVLPVNLPPTEVRVVEKPPKRENLATAKPAAPVPPPQQTYKVEPGDTLSGIATRLMGGGQHFQAIFEANRDRLGSPDNLPIGLELVIPRPGEAATIMADGPPAGPQLR